MDKYEKRILKYFHNEGRNKIIKADVLQKQADIPLKKFPDVIGSCVDKKYLERDPSYAEGKDDEYRLTYEGIKAFEEENQNSTNNRHNKILIGLSTATFIVVIITLFKP